MVTYLVNHYWQSQPTLCSYNQLDIWCKKYLFDCMAFASLSSACTHKARTCGARNSCLCLQKQTVLQPQYRFKGDACTSHTKLSDNSYITIYWWPHEKLNYGRSSYGNPKKLTISPQKTVASKTRNRKKLKLFDGCYSQLIVIYLSILGKIVNLYWNWRQYL